MQCFLVGLAVFVTIIIRGNLTIPNPLVYLGHILGEEWMIEVGHSSDPSVWFGSAFKVKRCRFLLFRVVLCLGLDLARSYGT